MFYMLGYCMSNKVMPFVVMWYFFWIKTVYQIQREFFFFFFFFEKHIKRVFRMEDNYSVETV